MWFFRVRRPALAAQPIAKSTNKKHPQRNFRPCLEGLEARTVPTALHVTTVSDAVSHTGTSLRDAIAQANTDAASGTSDTIDFSGLSGSSTITLVQGSLHLTGAGAGTISISGAGQVAI